MELKEYFLLKVAMTAKHFFRAFQAVILKIKREFWFFKAELFVFFNKNVNSSHGSFYLTSFSDQQTLDAHT